MNDFERRLAQLPLRAVPPDLRREVLAHAERAGRKTHASALLDWLWPSPLAWASLVVVWITLVAAFLMIEPFAPAPQINRATVAPTPLPEIDRALPLSLFAYHTRPELFADLARTP